MIKNIIDLLQIVEEDTENIKIAKGKYALPKTLKEGLKQIAKLYRDRIYSDSKYTIQDFYRKLHTLKTF